MGMPSIWVKDIPPDLHQRLKEAAAHDRRSLSKEIIALLEAALTSRSPALPPPIEGAFPLTDEWLEQAIAEGRERQLVSE